MKPDKSLLLKGLTLNAAFSAGSGLLIIVTAGWLARQFSLPGAGSLYPLGVFLLLFSGLLWNIVRTQKIRTWEIVGIISGDLAWVVASAVVVFLYYGSLTTPGLILVDGVALAVLFFAILQIRGLRKFRRAAG